MTIDNQTYFIVWHPEMGYELGRPSKDRFYIDLDVVTQYDKLTNIEVREVRIIPADAVVCDVSKVEKVKLEGARSFIDFIQAKEGPKSQLQAWFDYWKEETFLPTTPQDISEFDQKTQYEKNSFQSGNMQNSGEEK